MISLIREKIVDILPELNAVLVKELREELRAKSFVHSTFWFHLALFLITAFSLPAYASASTIKFLSSTFWFALALPLLVILPIRAFGAFSKERNANEFELIFLTNVSASRLAFYKWLSYCLQGSLWLTAALPYTVVRYFLCHLNPVAACYNLGVLFLSMLFLIASGILISSWRSGKTPLPGFLLGLGFLFILPLFNFIVAMIYAVTTSGSRFASALGVSTSGPPELLVATVFGGVAVLLLLEAAASNVAPRGENHSFRKRLLGLLALFLAFLFQLRWPAAPNVIVCTGILILGVIFGALSEHPQPVLSIYAGIARFGRLPRFLRRLFYPGWLSGLRYTFVVAAIFYILFGFNSYSHKSSAFLSGVAIVTSLNLLLFPIPLINLFSRLRQKRFFGQAIFHVIFFCLASILFGLSHASEYRALGSALGPILPHYALFTLNDHSLASDLGLLACLVIIIFVQSRPSLKIERKFEQEAKIMAVNTGLGAR